MSARRLICLLPASLLVIAAGCGSSSRGSPGGTPSRPDLTVSAAASLTKAFTEYGSQFKAADAKFSFAGSDELAAQIQHGVKPDVFASANTELPDMLYRKRLVAKPVVFASNRLVIAVPAGSTKVRSLADLAKPRVTVAMGSPRVPVGSYARKVLSGLAPAERKAILANVRSNEPEVNGIIAKVTAKAVDAGLVYLTDVQASSGKAMAVPVPDRLQPQVAYGVVVVRGARHPSQARAFIAGLVIGAGQQDLRNAGFLAPK
jgi:molybdate transport system substrate-binding protein